MHDTPGPVPIHQENRLLLAIAIIQFVNVVDYTLIVPMAPDIMQGLALPISQIGIVTAAFALSAALSAFVNAFFLDNFSRKKAALFFLGGLNIATVMAVFAWNMPSLIVARFCAGFFSGPLATLSIALVADYIPPERRGTAMGKIMAGLSIATILAVPLGLYLSANISWRAPFVAIAMLGFVVLFYGSRFLPYHPPLVSGMTLQQRLRALKILLQRKSVFLSFLLIFFSMGGMFMIAPHIASFLEFNLHYPRESIGTLYFIGGLFSFMAMRLAGRWIDRTSVARVGLISSLLFVYVLLSGFIYENTPVPAAMVFIGLMVAMTSNNVCNKTLYSKIPPPEYRGVYTGFQIALVNIMQAAAAFASSFILIEENKQLVNMPILGGIAALCYLFVPPLYRTIETHLKKAY